MRKSYPSLQTIDLPIEQINGKWMVGRNTPLEYFLTDSVINFITQNAWFHEITLISHIDRNDKQYRTHYIIRKGEYSGRLIMRIAVDTRGEFDFEFEFNNY